MIDGAPGCLLAEKEKEKGIKQDAKFGRLSAHGMIGSMQNNI